MECKKCGYEADNNKEKLGKSLCEICYLFSPDDEATLNIYINEKLEGTILETFRKHFSSAGVKQKKGMMKKAVEGKLMSRAPFGYTIKDKKLISAENNKEVIEIFEEFLDENVSLRKLAEKHNLSVNGLKKILKNFTYIGKIKFNNQIYQGTHEPIISSTLFNHVQNKLENLGIK